MVSLTLGSEMLRLGGLADSTEEALEKLTAAIRSGAGLERFRSMVRALGGQAEYLDPERIDELCAVRKEKDIRAAVSGTVVSIGAMKSGLAAQMLGAGRAVKTDRIDPAVGLEMRVRVGDIVRAGDVICTLHVNDEKNLEQAEKTVLEAVAIGRGAPEKHPLIYEVIR